jgi:hypothetical protein
VKKNFFPLIIVLRAILPDDNAPIEGNTNILLLTRQYQRQRQRQAANVELSDRESRIGTLELCGMAC